MPEDPVQKELFIERRKYVDLVVAMPPRKQIDTVASELWKLRTAMQDMRGEFGDMKRQMNRLEDTVGGIDRTLHMIYEQKQGLPERLPEGDIM
jgi:hypothetical protein